MASSRSLSSSSRLSFSLSSLASLLDSAIAAISAAFLFAIESSWSSSFAVYHCFAAYTVRSISFLAFSSAKAFSAFFSLILSCASNADLASRSGSVSGLSIFFGSAILESSSLVESLVVPKRVLRILSTKLECSS